MRLQIIFKAGADFCSHNLLTVHYSLSCTSVATTDGKNDPVYTSKIWKMLISTLNKGFSRASLPLLSFIASEKQRLIHSSGQVVPSLQDAYELQWSLFKLQ